MRTEVRLAEIFETDLLAGRSLGSRHLVLLMDRISASTDDGQVLGVQHDSRHVFILDFSRIQVVTSSYLAAALWPLWSSETLLRADAYPVLANLDAGVRDEIEYALKARGSAAWVCRPGPAGLEGSLIGNLDDSLRTTLRHFDPLIEVGATDLASSTSGESIGATAWNNRLSALHELRLLHRRKSGRRQVYSLPWSEVCHG